MKNRIFILASLVLGLLTVTSTQAAPVPFFGDPGLQECVDEHAGQNNWQEAEEFEYLVCDNRGITDISGIDQLINLTRLSLAENNIVDIGPLGAATQLTSLNLSGNSRIDITQLFPVLPNNSELTELGLADIIIGDLYLLPLHDGSTGQPLNLTRLNISNTGIDDINRLMEFPALQFLDISANNVDDLGALQDLIQLEEVYLERITANNLDALNGHTQLVHLNLAGNRNIDFMNVLPILRNNPNLRALDLSGITISDPNFLALNDPNTGMPYPLEELHLADTSISDISFVAFYPELEVLDISDNRVSDITALDSLSSLTHLDISDNRVSHLSLHNLTTLTTLRVSGNSNINLSDVYAIIDLNQELTRLGLGDIAIGDLFQLPAMYNYNTGHPYALIELDISNTGISDLSRLQEFPSLQYLDVSDNLISELSPLSQLLDLQFLDADNNQITDITPLGNLTRLTSLKLSGNNGIDANQLHPIFSNNSGLTELGLGDIAIGDLFSLPLYNHNNWQWYALTYLDIGNTGITYIYGLEQFPNLRHLDISDNPVESVDSLQYLTQLEELNLGQIQLSYNEIDLLNGYTKLTRLNLAGNRNIDFMQLLPILQNNPNLQALDLSGIAIHNSNDLVLWDSNAGRPYSLTELRLANTDISNIDFLSFYPDLKILDISNNNISDITELNDLHSLKELDISYNQIENVTPLNSLTTLTTLRVSGNSNINLNDLFVIIDLNQEMTRLGLGDIAIGDLFQLPAMYNYNTGQPYALIELDISNTGISDLFRLQEYPSLQHLDISDNNISDLSPLSQLLDLQSLDADNNQITDITALGNLTHLTSLKLSGNSGINVNQLHPIVSNNPGLRELGLGDIAIDDLFLLPLYNYNTGQSYALTYLDIGNTGIPYIYSLEQFPNLRYLDISDNPVEYLDPLQYLTQLEELNLGQIKINNIELISGYTKLTSLKLAGNRNIEFMQLLPILQNNPNLQALDLSGIAIHNSDDLVLWDSNAGRPYPLTELRLANTDISNIDFLSVYPDLKILDISSNNISDITELNDLHSLTELNISYNRIQNVASLSSFTSLTTLRVSGNPILNLNELYTIIDANQSLTRLGLGDIAIGDLLQLPTMFNHNIGQPYALIELDISNTGISDLTRLQEFPSLQHLDISDNNISDISPLSQSLDLRSLDADNNQIIDITALDNLTRLTLLKLSGNSGISVNQLHPILSNNPGLTELGLGDIAIGDLYSLPLHNFHMLQPYNLSYLNVSNTGINNLDRIAEFKNLKYLNASQNNLAFVIELDELIKLEKIDLSENQISNVNFLAGLSGLTDLRLAGNSGINFSDLLIVLQNNPLLNVLDVSGINVPEANLLLLIDPATGLPYRFNELYLSNTGINQVDFLWAYPDLRVLDISGNSLNDLSGIPLLSGLTVLNVSHNQIENLGFLTQLPGLLSVDLSNNDIKDINPLLPLTQLVNLNLFGNNEIPCPDLDLLLSQFPFGTVIPPAECFNGMTPELTLLSPMDGTTFTNIDSIPLEATANDAEDGDITANITWSSDLDGTIATGNGQNVTLSVGTHILTATITDSDGNSSSDTITVIVQQPQYCDAGGISSTHDWIEEFSIGDYTSTTGNNNGYANFTSNEPIPIAWGDSIVTVLPAGNAFYNRESWRIWIDLNRDGEFSTSEIVFSGRSTKYFSKTMSLPPHTTPGLTVMRVSMKYGSFPTPCEVFPWGEVEDYRVEIQ